MRFRRARKVRARLARVDDKTPKTPVRQTLRLQMNVELARQVGKDCRTRARQLAGHDIPRSNAFGDLAGLADYYLARFEAWLDKDISETQKTREQAAFFFLAQAATTELHDSD